MTRSGVSGGNDEWRTILTEPAYRVLFEGATEVPWSSPLHREAGAGTYVCAACFTPLFRSADKRRSGTGWPTFVAPLPNAIAARKESSSVTPRIEYHCATCGGHQGHLRRDFPWVWRIRWCNNGAALRFVPEAAPLPAPRTPAG